MVPEASSARGDDDSLAQIVRGYITAANSPAVELERRKEPRISIPYVFDLTPIDDEGNLIKEQASTVVGRDLSCNGISFSFDEEPKFKRALISLDHPAVGRFAVVAQLVWSKQTLVGLFDAGCELICTVDNHTVHGDAASNFAARGRDGIV